MPIDLILFLVARRGMLQTDMRRRSSLSINSPFLTRQKDFPFFPVGRPRPEPSPKTQPLQVAFSLLDRVDLRFQKEGILGKKIGWGRVGWTRQKKGKKDAQEKVGQVGGGQTCKKLTCKIDLSSYFVLSFLLFCSP